MYKLREEREIKAKTFAHLVSSTLYEKRFGPYFTEPCIAGLDEDPKTGAVKPFICSMDLIGCINFAKDFVVTGTASPNLYGMCEALWEPDLVSWWGVVCSGVVSAYWWRVVGGLQLLVGQQCPFIP